MGVLLFRFNVWLAIFMFYNVPFFSFCCCKFFSSVTLSLSSYSFNSLRILFNSVDVLDTWDVLSLGLIPSICFMFSKSSLLVEVFWL